jgi:uncharacterized protein YjbI with pentapeptide repeats
MREADLTGIKAAGAVLRGLDLSGAWTGKADFRGADLRGSDLSSFDLDSTDLRSAIITVDQTVVVATRMGLDVRAE